MADKFSKKTRSYIMSRIRGKRTKPELMLKDVLDGRVFRYQPKGILGNPDFASKKHGVAVFIDGCFWHGCPKCYREPKSNRKFWIRKVRGNRDRDRVYTRRLRAGGYNVIRLWEHQVLENPRKLAIKINKTIA